MTADGAGDGGTLKKVTRESKVEYLHLRIGLAICTLYNTSSRKYDTDM